MKIRQFLAPMLLASLILPMGIFSVVPAHADRDHRFRHFRHFDHDGYWFHGNHGGVIGWWWIAGPGLWYWYPRPFLPYGYPPYYDYDPNPPIVIAPPAQEAPPQQSYWYYCDSSKAYYPYVRSCPGGWRKVPATPPGGE